jgi:hypothetical protein
LSFGAGVTLARFQGEIIVSSLVRPRVLFLALAFILILAAGVTSVSAEYTCILDQQGADDEPGQKDLNQLCEEDAPPPPTELQVEIWWDQDGWTGNNSGDACILIDTDGDDLANWALCEVVKGTPAAHFSTAMYECTADSRRDRCGGPDPVPTFLSSCTATTLIGVDPFHAGEDDAVATCDLQFSDFGDPLTAEILDICSFPSQQPNSDPSDCIIAPTDPTAIVGSQALAIRSGSAGIFLAGAFGLLLLGTAAVGYRAVSVRRND